MNEVLEFLKKAGVFYLATSDGNQPHVRPLGFVMEHEGKLAFCTSNEKSMYRQMAANPNVEICCINAEYVTLRITGTVAFATSEETQRKVLEAMPSLSRLYTVGDGKFEIFLLQKGQAVIAVMGGDKRTLDL